MVKVNTAIYRRSESGNDVRRVAVLPAAFLDLHAPGFVWSDFSEDPLRRQSLHRFEISIAPVVDRHPFDREIRNGRGTKQLRAAAYDLAAIEHGINEGGPIDISPCHARRPIAQMLQDPQDLAPRRPEAFPWVLDEQIRGGLNHLEAIDWIGYQGFDRRQRRECGISQL